MSIEKRQLLLKSSFINASNTASDYFGLTVITEQGIIANNRLTLTWNNVNLRMTVGDDCYNKYNKFRIRLNQFFCGQTPQGLEASGAGLIATTNARYQDILLSGLPFSPTPYLQNSLSKTQQSVFMSSVVLPNLPPTTAGLGLSSIIDFAEGSSPCYTFLKNSTETCNITINLLLSGSHSQYVPATDNLLYGQMNFNFEIEGIDE
jgi:hypothetical protein